MNPVKKLGKRKEYSDHSLSLQRKENKIESGGSKKSWTVSPSQSSQRQKSNSESKPYCPTCHRYHMEECRKLTGGCYRCGDKGHHIRDCPRRSYVSQTGSETTVQNTKKSSKGKEKVMFTG